MSTVFWIMIVAAILAVLFSGKGTSRKPAGTQGKAIRVDHRHYYDEDDYECSVCGTRFRDKSMVCPHCGARFESTEENDEEFMEEMLEEDDWDEEDGL